MTSPDDSDTEFKQQARIHNAYDSFKHNASLTMLVLAPVLIAIPPRKLDLYSFSLTGAFVASINQLTVEKTGRGLISQFSYGRAPSSTYTLEAQKQALEDQQRKRLLEEKAAVPEEVKRRSAGVKDSLEGKARELWMGGEPEGWKEKRLKEEQEKLNQGEGYGGMIMDQIWEVWNWGEQKEEALKKKDEETVMEKNNNSKKG